MEASGITRRWGMCCNVSQLEADRQIAGYWLPSRNDPALNREATRVALRQGSFEPASEASPTDGGRPAPQKTGLRCVSGSVLVAPEFFDLF